MEPLARPPGRAMAARRRVPVVILLAALGLSVSGGWAVPRVAAAEPLDARQIGTGLPAATSIAGLTSGNVTIGGARLGHGGGGVAGRGRGGGPGGPAGRG